MFVVPVPCDCLVCWSSHMQICDRTFRKLSPVQRHTPLSHVHWHHPVPPVHMIFSLDSPFILVSSTYIISSLLLLIMDNPTEEIAGVVHQLCQGTPSEQTEAINAYFTPDASFTHPFCRTGSFDGSRNLIHAIYKWYKLLSPKIELNVNSVGTYKSLANFMTLANDRFQPMTKRILFSTSTSLKSSPCGLCHSTTPTSRSSPSCTSHAHQTAANITSRLRMISTKMIS